MAYDYSNPNLGAYLAAIQGLAPVTNAKGYATGLYRAGDYIYGPGYANVGQSGSGVDFNEGTTDYSKPTYLTRMKASDWDARGVDAYGNKLDANDGTYHDFIDPETGQYLYSDFEGNGDKEVSFGRFLEAAAKTWLAGYGATQAFGPAAGGETGASAGGFVGEGASSGVPAWDSAGFTIPEGASFTPATAGEMGSMGLGGAAGGAGGASAGAGGGSFLGSFGNGLKGFGSAVSSAFSGGGGGSALGGWGSLIGAAASLVGGAMQADAAGDAADAMVDSANKARELLQPYVSAGNTSLNAYQDLSGANGPDKQRAAMAALETSPQFASLSKAGENAILQNASATGGLRGGNVQGALADRRTQLLNGLQQQQLGNYLPVVNMGQNAAAGSGTLLTQAGAAQAGGIVAGTNAITNTVGTLGGFFAGQQAANPTSTTPTYSGAPVDLRSGAGFGSGVVQGYSTPTRLF